TDEPVVPAAPGEAVVARAAQEDVVSEPAEEVVVPAPATDHIVSGRAVELIVAGRAGDRAGGSARGRGGGRDGAQGEGSDGKQSEQRARAEHADLLDRLRPDARTRRPTGQRTSVRARSKTESSMGGVSLPVNVFCWLGWKLPTNRYGPHAASAP